MTPNIGNPRKQSGGRSTYQAPIAVQTNQATSLRSLVNESGDLTLSFVEVDHGEPAEDELIVRIEATPISPSDMILMFGLADIETIKTSGDGNARVLTAEVPDDRLPGLRRRFGHSMAIGNEGAGTVVAAGRNVQHMLGQVVGLMEGALYADYRKLAAKDVVVLPQGSTPTDGAAMFMNPLTVLGFIETARRGGHRAIIHTAAASSLGQMLHKVCESDGIALINIVRSQQQIDILRDIGARHVLNSEAPDFVEALADLAAETGATIGFDAIGGGQLAGEIMKAMERAAARKMTAYSRYGTETFKQLYIYGGLDPSPTLLPRPQFGFAWGINGWLLFSYLRAADPTLIADFMQRIVSELTTTFATKYTRRIGLGDVLAPEMVRAYMRRATGEKFLVDPTLG